MAGAAKLPRAMASPLHTTDAAALVAELAAVQQRSPKLVRSSVYAAPADPTISVRSWKMNEFKYYDIPSPFPTYARGLFTVDNRIVARGYDKFFNIGEVPWTEVCPPEPLSSLLTHSRASSGHFSNQTPVLPTFSLSSPTDASSSSAHSHPPSSS